MIYAINLDQLVRVVPEAIKIREEEPNAESCNKLLAYCDEYCKATLHKFHHIIQTGSVAGSGGLLIAFERWNTDQIIEAIKALTEVVKANNGVLMGNEWVAKAANNKIAELIKQLKVT